MGEPNLDRPKTVVGHTPTCICRGCLGDLPSVSLQDLTSLRSNFQLQDVEDENKRPLLGTRAPWVKRLGAARGIKMA